MKRARKYLAALVVLALILSVAMGMLVMAAEPPGANADNVALNLNGWPLSQRAGQDVVYTITVRNDQSDAPGSFAAYARNITVTFYPAQAGNGTPSATGIVVGNISLLMVDVEPIVYVVTRPMPALDPGVTMARSIAVLNGTSMTGVGGGVECIRTSQTSVRLLSEPPVGGAAFPVNKVSLVAPWAILLGCAGAVTLLILRRRRQG